MRRTVFSSILALLAFTMSAAAEPPALIPVDVLLGNPTRSQARISPDGKFLSYLGPSEDDVRNVWVQPLDGSGEPVMVTNDTHRGIRIHFWAHDGQHLLYMQDLGGDENWHVYSANMETKVVRDLTPFQGVRAQNIITSRHHPHDILVGMNIRNRSLFDMYRINLKTGGVTLDTENPGDVLAWLPDPDFVIRAAFSQSSEDGSQTLRVRSSADGEWRDLMHWPFGESGFFRDFSADGKSLFVESNLESDTSRLLQVDVATGEVIEILAEDPRSDLGQTMIHPERHEVQAVRFNYLMPEWDVLDQSIAADFERLGKVQHGAFSVNARDHADRTWIVSYQVDNGPVTYYAYDRSNGEAKKLFVHRPELEEYELAEMKPVVIKSRDGLDLVSYLTVPPGSDGKNLPMVLQVHGGPWARDSWGFDPMSQLFANRGYAVLQVNFRGSEGFGKSFKNAGDKQWGVGTMQHDLTDAVKWAIDQGIAMPDKVAIMGGSYGGYATLAGLAFTPDVYACGVDIVGPSHIKTLFSAIPPYWKPFRKELVLRVGDVESDEDFNRKISPLFHVDNIDDPLLIGQGANDPRVNINESDQIVEAMRKKNLAVTYVVYSDEGHGFARPENRLDFYGRADRFLADCLGGRAEAAATIEGTTADLR